MRGRSRFVLVLAALALRGAAACGMPEATGPPPAPTRWVTDDAGLLEPETVRALDARLERYERETGHQVLVYLGDTTGGVPIEDWAVRAFERWRVGRADLDDGVVLFVFRDDRRARIEVGYGLEDRIPDATAHRILDETVLPRMRRGDPDGAIAAGVEAILAGIEGRGPPGGGAPSGEATGASGGRETDGGDHAMPFPPSLSVLEWIALGIAALVFLVLLATNPALALWLLASIATRGRAGGAGRGWGVGGGGRGWSGGGGRSGGGGASGSW